MKIELLPPYSFDWKYGYLIHHKKENRKYVVLYNSHTSRSTTQYSRYLLSTNIGRYLKETEFVDHIDSDKTNDTIENLQILSMTENNQKDANKRGRYVVDIKCPNCGVIFTKPVANTPLHDKTKGICFCTRTCIGKFFIKANRGLTPERKHDIFEKSIIKTYREFDRFNI